MSKFMCSDCGEAYMYCACEENPLNSDKLSLDGSGGVTRRMTDKERIQELEKQLETANANACFQASLNGKRINKLENQLAESVPKSEIKNLDEMWPIFLHWVNDYVGQNTNTFGNVPYSREDMRYAFQAGYELMQEKAK
jgi:hypothetical protein